MLVVFDRDVMDLSLLLLLSLSSLFSLSVSLPRYLSIYLSLYLSIYLSISLSISLSIYLSLYLSIYLLSPISLTLLPLTYLVLGGHGSMHQVLPRDTQATVTPPHWSSWCGSLARWCCWTRWRRRTLWSSTSSSPSSRRAPFTQQTTPTCPVTTPASCSPPTWHTR